MNQPNQQPVPAAQPVQLASRVGQATAVEQSRAVAEVQAAIVVAQQCPRDTTGALTQMRQSCQQKVLADKAFYRFGRGGQQITGPTIHLARELARCWGNIQYGIAELRRDDDAGQSEMQAWAWDVQTNTRSSQTFIVPHKRDVKGGPRQLTDMRDIYENNANNGARRLREAIYAVLPPWLVDEATELCNQTITDGGGKSLPQRIADSVAAYDKEGVSLSQLEAKIGRDRDAWTPHDVAQLGVIYTSLSRRETSLAEEFPPPRVTPQELEATKKPVAKDEPYPEEPDPEGAAFADSYAGASEQGEDQ